MDMSSYGIIWVVDKKIVDPLAKLFIEDNKKNNLKCKSYKNETLKLQNWKKYLFRKKISL